MYTLLNVTVVSLHTQSESPPRDELMLPRLLVTITRGSSHPEQQCAVHTSGLYHTQRRCLTSEGMIPTLLTRGCLTLAEGLSLTLRGSSVSPSEGGVSPSAGLAHPQQRASAHPQRGCLSGVFGGWFFGFTLRGGCLPSAAVSPSAEGCLITRRGAVSPLRGCLTLRGLSHTLSRGAVSQQRACLTLRGRSVSPSQGCLTSAEGCLTPSDSGLSHLRGCPHHRLSRGLSHLRWAVSSPQRRRSQHHTPLSRGVSPPSAEGCLITLSMRLSHPR
ncbi:unnamed protein product [Arctogadus glacialis]